MIERLTGQSDSHTVDILTGCFSSTAEIFRFQRFYRQWAEGVSFELLKAELYDHYYDQAHFTKEFRRMTGHSPQRLVREVSNEFGRRLVRQQASSR